MNRSSVWYVCCWYAAPPAALAREARMSLRLLPRCALAGLLLAGPAVAASGPRIAEVRPASDLPYLIVEVEYPRGGAELRFTFEADGRPAPSRALSVGSEPTTLQATYLVYPGAACQQLVARWGEGAEERTAPAAPAWAAPTSAVLLGRLGDREALLQPAELEFQVFPPAVASFLHDGAPLLPRRVEAGGPGQRLRISPPWHPGLNEIRMVVAGPAGTRERAFTFVLLEEGGLAPGDTARLVYGEVGSKSGPFYRLTTEGEAVVVAGEGFGKLATVDDGWIFDSQVLVAKLEAKKAGPSTLRIERKGSFLFGEYEPVGEHRIRVGAAGGGEKGASGLRRDPVEVDPRYQTIFAGIDAEVDALLADDPRRGGEGFCHVRWRVKKRLLAEKYGIAWRSPDELNPQVIFD
jgi:hypothetical protein